MLPDVLNFLSELEILCCPLMFNKLVWLLRADKPFDDIFPQAATFYKVSCLP
jgi:hypothetical protein